jgi:hypothetical protein
MRVDGVAITDIHRCTWFLKQVLKGIVQIAEMYVASPVFLVYLSESAGEKSCFGM